MSSSARRVVLTGIGLVTPLGLVVATFWEALCAGRSGVRRIRSFDTSTLPVRFGGEVDGLVVGLRVGADEAPALGEKREHKGGANQQGHPVSRPPLHSP